MVARSVVKTIVLPMLFVVFSCSSHAQDAKPLAYDCHHYTSDATAPVSSRLRQVLDCYANGLVAITQEIPSAGYIQPVWGPETIGHNVGHVAFISAFTCNHDGNQPDARKDVDLSTHHRSIRFLC